MVAGARVGLCSCAGCAQQHLVQVRAGLSLLGPCFLIWGVYISPKVAEGHYDGLYAGEALAGNFHLEVQAQRLGEVIDQGVRLVYDFTQRLRPDLKVEVCPTAPHLQSTACTNRPRLPLPDQLG